MTARHPDAGGLSVENLDVLERVAKQAMLSVRVNPAELKALCAMARRSIQMREALEKIVAFDDPELNADDLKQHDRSSGYASCARVVSRISRAALAPTQSGGEGA